MAYAELHIAETAGWRALLTHAQLSAGVRISFGPGREGARLVPAETVVLCTGQESNRALADRLVAAGRMVHVIGGADVAAELDAKRAINQAMRLAATL